MCGAIKIIQQHPDDVADEGYRLVALESAEATKALLGEPPLKDFDAGAYLRSLSRSGESV